MARVGVRAVPLSEDEVAEVVSAAYLVALRHGLRAPFIDVELDLWRELRAVLGPAAQPGGADVQ
jgi:hypothetical protein